MKKNFLKEAVKTTALKIDEHSPEILLITGIGLLIGGAVLACKASTKIEDVVDDAKNAIDDVKMDVEEGDVTPDEGKKELSKVYIHTGLEFAKLYGPAVIMTSAGIVSLLASNRIMRKRTAALTSSLAAVDSAFRSYRDRVAEKYGDEAEKEIRYGIKETQEKELVTDEKGKTKEKTVKKKVITVDPTKYSEFAKFFDSGSRNWEPDAEYNKSWLIAMQEVANDNLRTSRNGVIFLNDVYEMLDIPITKAGTKAGWVYDPDICGNQIDFGIFVPRERNAAFVNGDEDVIILDFNCQRDITGYLK